MIIGILLCSLVALVAIMLAPWLSFLHLGSVTLAIILGMIVGNLIKIDQKYIKGIAFCEKRLLTIAIAFMGLSLNYIVVKELGYISLLVIIGTIMVTIGSAFMLNKFFKFDAKLAFLLGIGNAFCGSSAIAASNKFIAAEEDDVGLSIAVVNLLGTLGIFILPMIATAISFSDHQAGILVGNSIQAVGQVVAAGYGISDAAGTVATIIKMMRILMLLPLLLTLYCLTIKKTSFSFKTFPLFVVGFVLLSLIPNFNLLPEEIINVLSKYSKYMLVVAMSGIGLKIKFAGIFQKSRQALGLGLMIWIIQIIFSLLLIGYLF